MREGRRHAQSCHIELEDGFDDFPFFAVGRCNILRPQKSDFLATVEHELQGRSGLVPGLGENADDVDKVDRARAIVVCRTKGQHLKNRMEVRRIAPAPGARPSVLFDPLIESMCPPRIVRSPSGSAAANLTIVEGWRNSCWKGVTVMSSRPASLAI